MSRSETTTEFLDRKKNVAFYFLIKNFHYKHYFSIPIIQS